MDRRLVRTVIGLLVVTVLGGFLLTRQAERVARVTDTLAVDTAAPGPPTDSAGYVAAAVAAHDADRRVRGAPPRAVRVASFQPDSAGVVLRLVAAQSDSAVWVRVYPDGRTTVGPFRP